MTAVPRPLRAALLVVAIPLGALYIFGSFTESDPVIRLAMRVVPVLPLAIWTLWFDRTRPFASLPPAARLGTRVLSLLGIMALAVAVLGVGLNWLYDPGRVG